MAIDQEFFVPGLDPAEASDVLSKMKEAGHRPLYSVTYLHDGNRFVITVGERRVEYPRRTGPRGGYIKDAEPVRHGSPTGSTVLLIARTPSAIEVHAEPPSMGWSNPSIVGLSEVEQVIAFTDA